MISIQRTDQTLNVITDISGIFKRLVIMAGRYLLEWIVFVIKPKYKYVTKVLIKIKYSIPRTRTRPTQLEIIFKLSIKILDIRGVEIGLTYDSVCDLYSVVGFTGSLPLRGIHFKTDIWLYMYSRETPRQSSLGKDSHAF